MSKKEQLSFKEQFARAQKMESAKAQAEDDSNKVKDKILEYMAGVYFRVEQLRYVQGSNVTLAEVVNRMPDEDRPVVKAMKYSWTQPYMVEAFYKIMEEDGETVDAKVLGNLDAIDAPDGPVRVKI